MDHLTQLQHTIMDELLAKGYRFDHSQTLQCMGIMIRKDDRFAIFRLDGRITRVNIITV